jgi:dipeptidase D
MMVLENLYPQKVFQFFEEMTQIPHGSKNTKAISDYLAAFARERDLEYYQDELNNVVIIKEATAGYEAAEPIIIQGHMDMVCEKENDCDIDFEKDGLRLKINGDLIEAEGTTLGGDDGIAVAYALALLDSNELSHPRLEVVVTVDEEIGMLGALGIDLSMLKGHIMLNVDSEEEGTFLTGCAGGLQVHASIPVKRILQNGQKLKLTVTGLLGGHSGGEIDKERANADILMGRVLYALSQIIPFGIISMAGGQKDNAIPRECKAEIIIPAEQLSEAVKIIDELNATLSKEYFSSDPGVKILAEDCGSAGEEVLDYGSVNRIIYYLRSVPNGVINMSQVSPGLVETSLNLGIMELLSDELKLVTSIRSSVGSRKADLCERVCDIVEMVGGQVVIDGEYPAWEYKPDSSLRPQIAAVYEKLYGKAPEFSTIHAGLECGLLSDKIPNLDCVSFGPNIYDIHTPSERLSIESTGRVWEFIVEFLKNAK